MADLDENEGTRLTPLFSKDEMNLVEFPLGPLSARGVHTYEVNHAVFDPQTKRETTRKLLVTGSEAFGLPRPVDEQVLVGLNALSHEADFADRKVWFSRYHLCRTLGWKPDGRSYQRLESSLDRLAGTTLKFKNSWWDKGEQAWRSHTFHLIDNVELCSMDRYATARARSGHVAQSLCFFVWNEVIWKSFQDGYIKTLDMEMFRRISSGRRRELPLRLFRWLDKRFWRGPTVRVEVKRLAQGSLGLAARHVSQACRSLQRAAKVLEDVGFLGSLEFQQRHGRTEAVFRKFAKHRSTSRRRPEPRKRSAEAVASQQATPWREWLERTSEQRILEAEGRALAEGFGTRLEQDQVRQRRKSQEPLSAAGPLRLNYVRRYLEPEWDAACRALVV